MTLIKKIASFVWRMYFGVNLTLTFILLYPIYYILLSNEKHLKKGFKLVRAHSKLLIFLAFIRVKNIGLFPPSSNKKYIITPNHSSYIDILMLYHLIEEPFVFMAKKELGNIPLFNIFFKKLNLLVDRQKPASGKKAISECINKLNQGFHVVIFPEGTIPAFTPRLKSFKKGAFKLAIEQKCNILPITFLTNHKILEATYLHRCKGFPFKAKNIIHPVISTQALKEKDLVNLCDTTKNIIEETLIKNEQYN